MNEQVSAALHVLNNTCHAIFNHVCFLFRFDLRRSCFSSVVYCFLTLNFFTFLHSWDFRSKVVKMCLMPCKKEEEYKSTHICVYKASQL